MEFGVRKRGRRRGWRHRFAARLNADVDVELANALAPARWRCAVPPSLKPCARNAAHCGRGRPRRHRTSPFLHVRTRCCTAALIQLPRPSWSLPLPLRSWLRRPTTTLPQHWPPCTAAPRYKSILSILPAPNPTPHPYPTPPRPSYSSLRRPTPTSPRRWLPRSFRKSVLNRTIYALRSLPNPPHHLPVINKNKSTCPSRPLSMPVCSSSRRPTPTSPLRWPPCGRRWPRRARSWGR